MEIHQETPDLTNDLKDVPDYRDLDMSKVGHAWAWLIASFKDGDVFPMKLLQSQPHKWTQIIHNLIMASCSAWKKGTLRVLSFKTMAMLLLNAKITRC